MKKIICALMTFVCLIAMIGCGSTENASDAEITSNWKLVSLCLAGENKTDYETLHSANSPKFHTDNGVDCTFSNNGKEHNGTITFDGEKYIIDLDGTDVMLEATIDGNILHLAIEGSDTYMEFKKK